MAFVDNILKDLLLESTVDLNKLRNLSRVPGGYGSHANRRSVWPKLLGVNRYDTIDFRHFVDRFHRDTNQINVDVNRSFFSFDASLSMNETVRSRRRAVLSDIITAIVSKNRQLYYYQVWISYI